MSALGFVVISFLPNQFKLIQLLFVGEIYEGKVGLSDSDTVTNDDTLARSEVVEGDDDAVTVRVDHTEGKWHRVFSVNTENMSGYNRLLNRPNQSLQLPANNLAQNHFF